MTGKSFAETLIEQIIKDLKVSGMQSQVESLDPGYLKAERESLQVSLQLPILKTQSYSAYLNSKVQATTKTKAPFTQGRPKSMEKSKGTSAEIPIESSTAKHTVAKLTPMGQLTDIQKISLIKIRDYGYCASQTLFLEEIKSEFKRFLRVYHPDHRSQKIQCPEKKRSIEEFFIEVKGHFESVLKSQTSKA